MGTDQMQKQAESRHGRGVLREFHSGAQLRQAWDEIAAGPSRSRAVDIAESLGVSEAELIASRVGQWAYRLDERGFANLLRTLPTVGPIMALTRNRSVVHEKVGQFGNVTVQPGHALVLNHDIDLRLFMNHWRHGFALAEPLADGSVRHCLQFFDAAGQAVHKVYSRPETDLVAWNAMVQRLKSPIQSDTVEIKPLPALPEDLPDGMIDISGLSAHWSQMQDTHDFYGLLRDYKVGRHQAMRLIGEEFAEPLSSSTASLLLEKSAASDLSIMCFVGNRGCIQIHTGPIEKVVLMGDWLNVMDPGFNLHLRTDHIRSSWLVRKPTADGIVTSIELFDQANHHVVQFFGERKPGQPENAQWRALAESSPRAQGSLA